MQGSRQKRSFVPVVGAVTLPANQDDRMATLIHTPLEVVSILREMREEPYEVLVDVEAGVERALVVELMLELLLRVVNVVIPCQFVRGRGMIAAVPITVVPKWPYSFASLHRESLKRPVLVFCCHRSSCQRCH